jgi:polyhydroxyalkanoate synthesis regulator phasin
MMDRREILKRLERGQISAEEAERLLAELDGNGFRKEKEEFEEKLNLFLADFGNLLKSAVRFLEERIEEAFPSEKE